MSGNVRRRRRRARHVRSSGTKGTPVFPERANRLSLSNRDDATMTTVVCLSIELDGEAMLHDGLMSNRPTACDAVNHEADAAPKPGIMDIDRRRSDRVPFPAELVLAWLHDMGTLLRFRVVDAGDGGFRIRTGTPIVEGMTGMVVRLLPSGEPLDRPVMVAWVGPPEDDGQRQIGLRYF